jgi:heat shock protein HtpX
MLNVYEQIDSNKRRSFVIMALFVVFVVGVVWVFTKAFGYGPDAVGMALIFSGFMSFSSYYWSDKIILTLSGARPASKKKDFMFYTVAENMAMAAKVPVPKLYVIDDTAMNAFATGRDPQHAVVCATTGLLSRLNRTELEGVIAHEMTHVTNYDIRLMSVVAVLVGLVTLLADWFLRSTMWGRGRRRDREQDGGLGAIFMILALVLALLSPLIANLIQLAISRRREFSADAGSVMLTRQPSGLISALQKLGSDREPLEAANKATAHLYIVNPLKNVHASVGWFASMFNTHPPIGERIKVLKEMM